MQPKIQSVMHKMIWQSSWPRAWWFIWRRACTIATRRLPKQMDPKEWTAAYSSEICSPQTFALLVEKPFTYFLRRHFRWRIHRQHFVATRDVVLVLGVGFRLWSRVSRRYRRQFGHDVNMVGGRKTLFKYFSPLKSNGIWDNSMSIILRFAFFTPSLIEEINLLFVSFLWFEQANIHPKGSTRSAANSTKDE